MVSFHTVFLLQLSLFEARAGPGEIIGKLSKSKGLAVFSQPGLTSIRVTVAVFSLGCRQTTCTAEVGVEREKLYSKSKHIMIQNWEKEKV